MQRFFLNLNCLFGLCVSVLLVNVATAQVSYEWGPTDMDCVGSPDPYDFYPVGAADGYEDYDFALCGIVETTVQDMKKLCYSNIPAGPYVKAPPAMSNCNSIDPLDHYKEMSFTCESSLENLTIRRIRYAEIAENAISKDQDRYYFKITPSSFAHSPPRTVVFFHGGGFCGGGVVDRPILAQMIDIAQQGYEVLGVEYRRGFVENLDKNGDGIADTQGCISNNSGTECGCHICEAHPSTFTTAATLAVSDAKLAIEYYLGFDAPSPAPELILYGTSAGASISLQLLTNSIDFPTFATDNNIVLGIIRSGGRIAKVPTVHYTVPLYILHNPSDNTVPLYEGFVFPKFCCSNMPVVKGGLWFYEQYVNKRTSLGPGDDTKNARAFFVSVEDGGHGVLEDVEYDYCNFINDGLAYYDEVIDNPLALADSFWDNNHSRYFNAGEPTPPYVDDFLPSQPPHDCPEVYEDCADREACECPVIGSPPCSVSHKMFVSDDCLSYLNSGAELTVDTDGEGDYSLYNLHGQLIQSGKIQLGSSQINLRHLENGYYLIRLQSEGCQKDTTVKLIVQH